MIMRDHNREPMPFFQARGIAPAAGFTSTVEDLARFASWQFRLLAKGGTEVIAANTLKEMHRVHWLDPNFTTARGWGYSVATRNGKIIVGHNGTCPGYHTQIDMSPKDKVAVIIMSNGNDVSPQTYSRNVFDIVAPAIAKAVGGSGKGEESEKSEKAEKAEKADPTLEKFVGRYDAPFGGETHVLIWDGSLTTFSVPTDNPVGTRPKYKRISDNVFRVVREDESLGETVTFELGPDGNVTRMIRSAGNYSIRVK